LSIPFIRVPNIDAVPLRHVENVASFWIEAKDKSIALPADSADLLKYIIMPGRVL
jgi:hypothetical protein